MKLNTSMAACLLAGGASWGGGCYAQPLPQAVDPQPAVSPRSPAAPSLRNAVEAAWQRATAARESAAGRERAVADQDAAQRLWAAPPSLEFMHRDDRPFGNAGRRETEMGLAWPLWLPGQRSANQALAQTAVERAATSARAARLQVAGLVRESAWRLIAEQAELGQLTTQADALRKLYDDVERRVKVGDLARADALAARAEWLALRTQASEAARRVDEARIRWRELTGLDALPSVPSIAEAPAFTGPQGVHPELEAAGKTVEQALRRLDLVRASTREAPELKFGLRRDDPGGVEGSRSSLALGIRVPFGTADRNRPLQASALGELDVARAAEERLRARIEADIQVARAALETAQRQLTVEQERAQLLGERASLYDRSFRAGQTALPDLLRIVAASAQANNAAARREIAVGHARARLQQAMGILP